MEKNLTVEKFYKLPENERTCCLVHSSGDREWYKEGKLHREDGPAKEYANGARYWYKEGKYHREDGPAVELPNGAKAWYKEDKLHREDGPAIELPSGNKYYINNIKLSYTEWYAMVNGIEKFV